MRNKAVFFLNGKKMQVGGDEAGLMVSDFLRQRCGLVGTKVVCAEGDCGACTILKRSSTPAVSRTPQLFQAVNSCVMPVAQLDGSSIVTVEGLASQRTEGNDAVDLVTPVQKAMRDGHGSQCGFCTPGIVMALTGAVEKALKSDLAAGEKIDEKWAKNALTGNLCRCTGYQQILSSACAINTEAYQPLTERYFTRSQQRELREATRESLRIEGDDFVFFAPSRLREAVHWLKKHHQARIIAGATDLGVLHNKRKSRLLSVLSLHLVEDGESHSGVSLQGIRKDRDGRIRIGAGVSISEIRRACQNWFPELASYLNVFASPQIKNVATLAGNIATASPIGDTSPALLVSEAIVHVVGPNGDREIPIERFFVSYRRTALRRGELIVAISLRPPRRRESCAFYKASERKDLDISSVNAGFFIRLGHRAQDRSNVIEDIRIAFGGVAAKPLRLTATEALLIGQSPDQIDIEKVVRTLHAEISPIDDVRGSRAFRRVLSEGFLRRFLKQHGARANALEVSHDRGPR